MIIKWNELFKMRLGVVVYVNTRIRESPSFIQPCQCFCKSNVGWGQKKEEGISATRADNSYITDQSLWVNWDLFTTAVLHIWKSLLHKRISVVILLALLTDKLLIVIP